VPYETPAKGIAIDCAYDTPTLGATWLFDYGDVTITSVRAGMMEGAACHLVTRARFARIHRV
jgi:hypothetical protein